MAFTVTVSLAVSLVFALTLVPMLASKIFTAAAGAPTREERLLARAREAYRRLLSWALARRGRVLGGVLLAFAGSLVLLIPIGKEFIPAEHDDLFMINIRLPRGTRVEVTDQASRALEDALRKMPEIRGVHAIIGVAQGAAPGVDILDPEYGFFLVRTTAEVARRKEVPRVIERARAAAAGIPQIERFSGVSLNSVTSGGAQEKALVVRIYGNDLGELERLSRRVKGAIAGIPGVRDVEESLTYGSPELQLSYDREALARLGLSLSQVAATAETYLKGRTAAYFRVRGDEVPIVVRLEERQRDSARAIADAPILLSGRAPQRLGDLARIETALGPGKILREGQKRKADVSANVSGRDINAVVGDARRALAAVPLPEGYFVEYAGSYKDMAETLPSLAWAFLLALLLIYMVMAAQFESLVHPFSIMCTVPFSLIGVILALFATGTTLSVNSFIGVVILAGVVVNNGIVLVDYTNRLRAKGMEKRAAILAAGATRLRPVLMTALTTILGVIPMYLMGGSGAELRRPLALTLGAGLLFGTALTLVVLPLVYSAVDRAGERGQALLRRVFLRS
jgi:HAE1 family hydrophobic/amphiphilic exporter-1